MVGRWSLSLALLALVPSTPVGARAVHDPSECDRLLAARFGDRVRTRDAAHHGRVLFSPDHDGRGGNTQAFVLGDARDADRIHEQLSRHLADLGGAAPRGDLTVSGLPLYHPEARAILANLRRTLADLGLDATVRVVPMYSPAGAGLRYWAGRLRALFPMRQDFERPVGAEIGLGAPGTLAAEATTVGYAFANFPSRVAVPLSISHFGLLGFVSTFTRTQTNWMNRSLNQRENLIKDFITSNVFIVNYSVMSNWPSIAASFMKNGLANPDVFPAARDYLVNQLGVTGVAQTAFFYFTFINGLWRWQALIDRRGDPELSLRARRASAIIQPAIFAISGPMLNWAATSHRELFRLGPAAINPGQVALLGLTALGGVAAAAPERVFTPLVDPINSWIYDGPRHTWARLRTRWAVRRD